MDGLESFKERSREDVERACQRVCLITCGVIGLSGRLHFPSKPLSTTQQLG